jgi:hypothetical protein
VPSSTKAERTADEKNDQRTPTQVRQPSPAVLYYEALGIRKEQIERRQAWQSYLETTFHRGGAIPTLPNSKLTGSSSLGAPVNGTA